MMIMNRFHTERASRVVIATLLCCAWFAARANAESPGVDDLVLWLKADAGVNTNTSGVVTSWVDQVSAKVVNNTGATPTVPVMSNNWHNGLPALHFAAQPSYGLTLPSGSLSIGAGAPRTIFLVLDIPAVQPSSSEVFGTYTLHMMDFGSSPHTNRIRIRSPSESLWSPAGSIPGSQPFIVCVTSDTNGQVYAFLNGDEVLVAANVPGFDQYFYYSLAGNVGIGWALYNGRNFRGHLAEVMLYERGLDDAERKTVFDHLAARYDVEVSYGNVTPLTVRTLPDTLFHRDTDAVFGAEILEGLPDSRIYLLWSTNAYLGDNLGGWDGTNISAQLGMGTFQTVVTNLTPGTTYAWRAFATNQQTGVWAPETNLFTTPIVAAPQPPLVSNGLLLHLSADSIVYTNGQIVTWWPDFVASQQEFVSTYAVKPAEYVTSVPELNNRPAMKFRYTGPLVGRIPGLTAGKDRTVYMVVIPDGAVSSEIFERDGSNFIALPGSVITRLGTERVGTGSGSLVSGVPHIVAIMDSAGQSPATQIWIDAVAQDQEVLYGVGDPATRYIAWDMSGPSTARVGGSSIGGRHYRGHLAELLVYDRVLTENEHVRVGMSLTAKYGLPIDYSLGRRGTLFMFR